MPALAPEVVLGLLAAVPALAIAAYPLHAARVLWRRVPPDDVVARPGWTVLVPLRGDPEGLDANLRRALAQETTPGTIWRFCVEAENDPGAETVRRAIARAAPADARVVVAGPPGEALAKAHNLAAGLRDARGDIVVLLDADAWLPHGRFLLELTAPLSASGAGMVTAYPWYVGARDLGASLLGAMVNADVLGTFALRAAWGGRRFANGTCMAVRRDALEQIGGLQPLARRMLMDSALADAIAAAGRTVSVHREPVLVRRARASLSEVEEQAHRWHVSLRQGLHGATYLALGWLRSAFVLALLAWACSPRSPWTIGLVASVASIRLASTAALAGLAGVARRSGPTLLAQLPADLLAPLVWWHALWDDRVKWQGRSYRIRPGARLEPRPRGSSGDFAARVRGALRFLRMESWSVQLPILALVALVLALAANASPTSYLPSLVQVALAQGLLLLGGYVFNDLCDARQDAVKGAAPPTRGARLAKRLLVPLALGAGVAVAWPAGAVARAIVLVQVVGGLAYSAPGVRLKERGWIGVFGAASLQRLPGAALIAIVHPPAPGLATLGGLWLAALGVRFILEHQLEDFDFDARAGVRTWSVEAGRERARRARDVAARVALGLVLAGAIFLVAAGPRPRAWIAAALWLAADRIGARLFARRYESRARPVSRAARPREEIRIYGAGLAGLVAAARLADWGYRVEVHEQRRRLGGMAESAPSVHSLQGDPEALERTLGLPVADLFEPIATERVRLESRTFAVEPRHVNVERGGRRGTIDQRLLELAEERGVVVRFASPLRPGDAVASGVTIVATGLGRVLERALGIEGDPVEGWVATGCHRGRATLTTFRRRSYGAGYAYVASRGDLRSALLFARGTLPASALPALQQDLADELGWRPSTWTRLRGMVPVTPRLERHGVLLAGTAAGLLDPFYLSGVEAALVSGALAAEAVVDRAGARRRFDRLTRGFAWKRALAARAWSPDAPAAETLAVALVNRALGRIGRAA